MLTCRLASSLEKCFPESTLADFPALRELSVLKKQKISFRLIYRENEGYARYFLTPEVGGDTVTLRTVELIPSAMPCYYHMTDPQYITTTPRSFPDLLKPSA